MPRTDLNVCGTTAAFATGRFVMVMVALACSYAARYGRTCLTSSVLAWRYSVSSASLSGARSGTTADLLAESHASVCGCQRPGITVSACPALLRQVCVGASVTRFSRANSTTGWFCDGTIRLGTDSFSAFEYLNVVHRAAPSAYITDTRKPVLTTLTRGGVRSGAATVGEIGDIARRCLRCCHGSRIEGGCSGER